MKTLPKRFIVTLTQKPSVNWAVGEHGVVLSKEEIRDLRLQFETEHSADPNSSTFVHIRSCYNNKYLTLDTKTNMIAAAADKTVETRSDLGCTLFEAISVNTQHNTFHLIHVQTQKPVLMPLYDPDSDPEGDHFGLCVVNDKDFDETTYIFTITDWDSLLILPRRVAFKGHNGKYLRALNESHGYLKFSGDNKRDVSVPNEIIYGPTGRVIYIKNTKTGKFWRRNPNWICTDADDTDSVDTHFSAVPIDLEKGLIALRSLGNGHFCGSLTVDRKKDCLNANYDSSTEDCLLTVEEGLLSKKIVDVHFHQDRVRIYHTKVMTMVAQTIINGGEKDITTEIVFETDGSETSTWSTGQSVTTGVSFNLSCEVPKVGVSSSITLSKEFSENYNWGQTKVESIKLSMKSTITVPGYSKLKAFMLVSRANCDVPFSYKQSVTFVNGESDPEEFEDGVFHGANYYDVRIETAKINEDGTVDSPHFSTPDTELPPKQLS